MVATVFSVALVGVVPEPIRVEVDDGGGEKRVIIPVGLPDTAVREARERVQSAISNSGYSLPSRRFVVNLSPADIPKQGSAYDLPMALGLLVTAGLVDVAAERVVALGELGLGGEVQSARGGLAAAVVARSLGLPCLLPPDAAAEAALVSGAEVRVVTSLGGAIEAALGRQVGEQVGEAGAGDGDALPMEAAGGEGRAEGKRQGGSSKAVVDLADVRGQVLARRGLEVAAAGGHHLFMSGPPGAGKTMLARALPSLLPRLSERDGLEVSMVYAAGGVHRPDLRSVPFRSPHHTSTVAALVGGGSGIPSPGEASLAHKGILFLDELGEFPPRLINALRQPIEDGMISIARRGITVTFPSDVQLIAATNPCPCGFYGDRRSPCTCTPAMRRRYGERFSGPIMDRFDMRVQVRRLEPDEIGGSTGEPSPVVAMRVKAARRVQRDRGGLNRNLRRAELDAAEWSQDALALLRTAGDRHGLTARGWDRVRRVARTIADLAQAPVVEEDHMAEALAFRRP